MTIINVKSWLSRALSLGMVLCFTASCVGFKQQALYDGVEPEPVPAKPAKLSLAVEPVIFEDDMTNVWFMENADCVKGKATEEEAYSGEKAILISWDRNAAGCEWSGMGIGWDNWAGKDISEIIPYAAIQMHVRAKEGRMFGLPMVLSFEDYSGGRAFSYTGNKYFERPFIDEEWQKVTVPLNTFDLSEFNMDPTNVKQMMIELQQSGSVYLDDIRLIFYEEEPQEPWLEEDPRPDPLALPITLFDESFVNDHGWGLMTDACQSIQIEDTEASSGSRALHLKWDDSDEDCFLLAFGVSWSNWYPVDITPIVNFTTVEFDLKTASGTFSSLPVQVVLQDYDRVPAMTQLKGDFVAGGQFVPEWRHVTIPLSELKGDAKLTNVKDLVFRLEGTGDLYIDNLRLVRQNR